MNPDDPNTRRPGTPLVPERQLLRPSGSDPRARTTEAAANIVRGQIDNIYNSPQQTTDTQQVNAGGVHAVQPTPSTTEQTSEITQSPYERTHDTAHTIQSEQWKQYHSAWQQYYQKYYERYYLNEVERTKQTLASQTSHPQSSVGSTTQPEPQTISKDEALHEIRNDLLSKLRSSAKKVRKSRHFIPITAALCVMLVFLFLQYNRVIFSNVEAYVSPGSINPANIIVDPITEVPVSAEPRLIIPKINVDVPIVFDTTPDQGSQLKAMENGVAWFGIPGANSKPGQVGNTVLSGHSSNDIVDGGNYKFIFARLEQLIEGDTVYVNYQGKRYTYTITKREVVQPTEVSKLVYPTDKPILTLITCTPLGTALNRLLVTAEQVSPDPKAAAKAPEAAGQTSDSASMPGNSPTFIQRLFGATSQ
ncbi:MAG TPA: sortase [Candidatus Saccharimonadales bacterium]|nr:sortase [Candidatus Saccharimonadales bacterium]